MRNLGWTLGKLYPPKKKKQKKTEGEVTWPCATANEPTTQPRDSHSQFRS